MNRTVTLICYAIAAVTVAGLALYNVVRQPALNGHWHVDQATASGFFNQVATIDIGADDVVLINDVLEEGTFIGGPIDRLRNHIILFPTCLSFNMTYEWQGETLLFTETGHDYGKLEASATAYRCNESCCNAQQDFFSLTDLKVDLPIDESIVRERVEKGPWDSGLLSFYVGYNARSDNHIILVNGQPLDDVANLLTELERGLIKLPEDDRSAEPIMMYADKDTPATLLSEIAELVSTRGTTRPLLRAYRTQNLTRPLRLGFGEMSLVAED
ncbi:hypothetical protein [Neolewinella antarctica]|uniref:Uncharacterized protein n=1 Tax=Neolewinella antarctica TaxID=442734 RepID=A0ABX0XD01_9BACT|nr:hypothetical protein [Neolewinella antarctica]NJC26811.1 hypothetical protein [Neolewinella antarctica]